MLLIYRLVCPPGTPRSRSAVADEILHMATDGTRALLL